MDCTKFLFEKKLQIHVHICLPNKHLLFTLYVSHRLSLLSRKFVIYGWFNPCCFRYLPGCKKCYTDDELIFVTDAEESDNEGKIKGQIG